MKIVAYVMSNVYYQATVSFRVVVFFAMRGKITMEQSLCMVQIRERLCENIQRWARRMAGTRGNLGKNAAHANRLPWDPFWILFFPINFWIHLGSSFGNIFFVQTPFCEGIAQHCAHRKAPQLKCHFQNIGDNLATKTSMATARKYSGYLSPFLT